MISNFKKSLYIILNVIAVIAVIGCVVFVINFNSNDNTQLPESYSTDENTDDSTIVVPETSAAALPKEKFQLSEDGNTIIMTEANEFDFTVFEYADKIDAERFCKDGFKVILGEAVIYFDALESSNDELSTEYCGVSKIEAYGKTIELSTNFQGNHQFNIQRTDEIILVTDYSHGVGDTYVISEGYLWEEHNSYANGCNDPIVSIDINSDGEMVFICQPRKYIFSPALGDLLTCSCGLDEIYMIEGTVTFDGNNPKYTIVSELTLSEKFTEDQFNEEFECINSSRELLGHDKYESIEALFERNRELYDYFEWKSTNDGVTNDDANIKNDSTAKIIDILTKNMAELVESGYYPIYSRNDEYSLFKLNGYDDVNIALDWWWGERSIDDETPILLRIYSSDFNTPIGINVGMSGEESLNYVSEWDYVWVSLEGGGAYFTSISTNEFAISVSWSFNYDERFNEIVNSLEYDDNEAEAWFVAYNRWIQQYRTNPEGYIWYIDISLID